MQSQQWVQISASKSMGVLLIKRLKPPRLASKQSLLGGFSVSTIQPVERKIQSKWDRKQLGTESTRQAKARVSMTQMKTYVQDSVAHSISLPVFAVVMVLYVSLIRIKGQKPLRFVIMSFKMFQTWNTFLWRGTLPNTSVFVILHPVLFGHDKITLYSQNIFQRTSLKLRDDDQIFFSSSMWQLWWIRVYSVFHRSP